MNNKDKIFSIFVGVVLLLALILSFFGDTGNLVGYASISIPQLFERQTAGTGDDQGDVIVHQDYYGGGGGIDIPPCEWNEDCPDGYYCNAAGNCVYVGECVERGRCGYGCVRYASEVPPGQD